MSVPKLTTEQTTFVTEEGLLTFITAMPSQATTPKEDPTKRVYGVEWVGDEPGKACRDAVTLVAQTHAPSNWAMHVTGPMGRLKKLEEYPTRDQAKYPYATGKYVIGFRKSVTLKRLKLENINLADPVQRQAYDQAVLAQAPGVKKYCSMHDPVDLEWMRGENQKRISKGMAPIQESELYKTLRPMESHEVWSGCYGRVMGHAYWEAFHKKTVLVELDFILFTKEGPRLIGEASPDKAFSAFAPTADLAPAPVGAPIFDWSKLV